MNAKSDSKALDRFKLLILLALVSLAIVLWLVLPRDISSGEPVEQVAGNQTATLTSAPVQASASVTPLPAATVPLQPTPETPPPTAEAPTETLTADATPVETEPVTTGQAEATPAGAMPPPDPESCPLALPSRLSVGMPARVITLLNVRSEPSIGENLLFVVLDTTLVEIIGGPVCQPHLDGAHWWWQIRLPEGETGWAVEGAYDGSFYYMEPAAE